MKPWTYTFNLKQENKNNIVFEYEIEDPPINY